MLNEEEINLSNNLPITDQFSLDIFSDESESEVGLDTGQTKAEGGVELDTGQTEAEENVVDVQNDQSGDLSENEVPPLELSPRLQRVQEGYTDSERSPEPIRNVNVNGKNTPSPRSDISKITHDSGISSKGQTVTGEAEEESEETMLDTMAEVTDISSEEQDHEEKDLYFDENDVEEEYDSKQSDEASKSEEDTQVLEIEHVTAKLSEKLHSEDTMTVMAASYSSSSGTTASSEEMNKTVISKEEAELYQSGENMRVLMDGEEESKGLLNAGDGENIANVSNMSSETSADSVVQVEKEEGDVELEDEEEEDEDVEEDLQEIEGPENVDTENQETQTQNETEGAGKAEDIEVGGSGTFSEETSALGRSLLSRVALADFDGSDELEEAGSIQVISLSDESSVQPTHSQTNNQNNNQPELQIHSQNDNTTETKNKELVTPMKKPHMSSEASPVSDGSPVDQIPLTPGPSRTPDLSVISGGDDSSVHSGEISDIQEVPESLPPRVSTALDIPHPISSQSTDMDSKSYDISMYTASTELAKYMANSQDTIKSSVTTLPHMATPISEEDEQIIPPVTPTPSTKEPQYTDSDMSSKERFKRGSYTLDNPSPALLMSTVQSPEQEQAPLNVEARPAQQQQNESSPAQKTGVSNQAELQGINLDSALSSSVTSFRMTTSMEDLRLKPVQRKLKYEDSEERQSNSESNYTNLVQRAANVEESVTAQQQRREELVMTEKTDSERDGKQEHLHRYLAHLSEMPQLAGHQGATPDRSSKSSPASGYPQSHDGLNYSDISSASHSGRQYRVQNQTLPADLGQVMLSAQELGQAPMSALDLESLGSLTESDIMHVQMEYFERLKQHMLQQQQQQLALLVTEQQKQQLLFQQEILKQGKQFQNRLHQTMPNMKPSTAHMVDTSLEQLNNSSFGQISPSWQMMAGMDPAMLQQITSMELAGMIPQTQPLAADSHERPQSVPTPKVSFLVNPGTPKDSPPDVRVHYYTPEHSPRPSPEPETVLRAADYHRYHQMAQQSAASPSHKQGIRPQTSPKPEWVSPSQRQQPLLNTSIQVGLFCIKM